MNSCVDFLGSNPRHHPRILYASVYVSEKWCNTKIQHGSYPKRGNVRNKYIILICNTIIALFLLHFHFSLSSSINLSSSKWHNQTVKIAPTGQLPTWKNPSKHTPDHHETFPPLTPFTSRPPFNPLSTPSSARRPPPGPSFSTCKSSIPLGARPIPAMS